MVLLLAPLFDLGVDISVFCQQHYDVVKAMVAKGGNFNLEKKVLRIAPLFETWVKLTTTCDL
jgi:hypothetical protein